MLLCYCCLTIRLRVRDVYTSTDRVNKLYFASYNTYVCVPIVPFFHLPLQLSIRFAFFGLLVLTRGMPLLHTNLSSIRCSLFIRINHSPQHFNLLACYSQLLCYNTIIAKPYSLFSPHNLYSSYMTCVSCSSPSTSQRQRRNGCVRLADLIHVHST